MQSANIAIHAFIGGGICSAIMGVGMAVTTLPTIFILPAIGGPVAWSKRAKSNG